MGARGNLDQVLQTGRIAYGFDGTNARPILITTGGKIILGGSSGIDIGDVDVLTLPQREPFIFRPGQAALANGMVASGSRSGGATVTSAGANTTTWGTEVVYEPKRAGKIDGLTTGGVVSGQITIGIVASAATPNGKLTARIRNKSGTVTTCLALTGAIALTTTEIFKTYDIPYLLTTALFNAVPFGIAIGVESDSASNLAVARIMESSFIMGEFEPGT